MVLLISDLAERSSNRIILTFDPLIDIQNGYSEYKFENSFCTYLKIIIHFRQKKIHTMRGIYKNQKPVNSPHKGQWHWNIVKWTLGNKFQWNPNQNSQIFIQENASGSVVWKMAAILSQPQCVKDHICVKSAGIWSSAELQWLDKMSGYLCGYFGNAHQGVSLLISISRSLLSTLKQIGHQAFTLLLWQASKVVMMTCLHDEMSGWWLIFCCFCCLAQWGRDKMAAIFADIIFRCILWKCLNFD